MIVRKSQNFIPGQMDFLILDINKPDYRSNNPKRPLQITRVKLNMLLIISDAKRAVELASIAQRNSYENMEISRLLRIP